MGNKKKKKINKYETEKKKYKKTKTEKPQKIKKERKQRKKHPKLKKIILTTLITILLLIVIAIGILAGIFFRLVNGEWAFTEEDLVIPYSNSRIYDKDGNLIGELAGDENRQILSKNEMSKYLFDAFVSIEDERFYEHSGVDLKRTLGATATYLFHGGESSYGGSTITQQVVKNLTGDKENSSWEGALRKVKEMTRAYQVEKILSKDQILELYLNLIPLGGGAKNVYGVQTAAKYYFNKPASDLSLVESAYLAGITSAPNKYNPFSSEDKSEKIKNKVKTVVKKMYELGRITKEEYDKAVEEADNGIKFEQGTVTQNTSYSYHTEAAIKEIIKDLMQEKGWSEDEAKLHLYSGGYKIYTTQDSNIQKIVEDEFKNKNWITSTKVKEKTEDGKTETVTVQIQSAMVIIDHSTGYVVGGAGALGEKTPWGINRMTDIIKQPGSSIKPIAVIGPSLEERLITAGTVVDDTPVSYGSYSPKNVSRNFKGLMNIRYIIRISENVPEVKLMNILTVAKSIQYLKKFGITTTDEKNEGLSLALGGMNYGVSPLEMAGAYATIANDGMYIEPTFYTKIVDDEDKVVMESKQETHRVLSEGNAYLLKSILTEPVRGGTGTSAQISGMDVAGKTGTTNEATAVWFCGFTPYYTGTVWYGYDTAKASAGGSGTPARMWAAVMKKLHSGLASKRFVKPDIITSAAICQDSGLLATEECKNDPRGSRVYTEYFVRGTVPSSSCKTHVTATICKKTGKIATEFCKDTETKVFITRPNAEKDTSWKSAADAEYMIPIETCNEHTKPDEPVVPPEPQPSESSSEEQQSTSESSSKSEESSKSESSSIKAEESSSSAKSSENNSHSSQISSKE